MSALVEMPMTPLPSPSALVLTHPTLERRAVTVKNRVQCKQDQVVSWLHDFYSSPGNLEKLLPILQGTSAVSLRLVDYFVTNYAKKMNTGFAQGDRHFLVYFNYKRELNAYSKRLFDPFCRRERIMFQVRGMEAFVTTVGQLNFFRWFIEKNILEHVVENREAIEKDMNATLKEHYSRTNTTRSTAVESVTSSVAESLTEPSESTLSTDSKSRKKRCELTKSAMRKVNIHQCDVLVSF
jgi:hypothetical protein